MKIKAIFAIVPGRLLALQWDGEEVDEWEKCFDNWDDVEFLTEHFEEHEKLLKTKIWKNISVENAVFRTIDEAGELEDYVLDVAKNGTNKQENTLGDLVFKPLHNKNTEHELIPSKAYGETNPNWLRIYAIQISPQLFVVTGSGIKLTRTMDECKLLIHEKKKLALARQYLIEKGFINQDDYQYIEITKKS